MTATRAHRVAPPPAPRGRLWHPLFVLAVGKGSTHPAARVLRTPARLGLLSLLVAQHPTARRRRAATLAAYWRCQAMRRRGHTYDVELGPDRGTLRCPPWSSLGAVTAATGRHEMWEQSFAEAVVYPGETAVDAGANIGFFTVPLAVRGAFVAAFEPAATTRAALAENVALNGLEARVRVFGDALSDVDGEGLFTTDREAQNRLVENPEACGSAVERVPVRRLDTVVAEDAAWFGDRPVTLVKVDVEGHEDAVLRGARGLIEAHRPVLLVETWKTSHARHALEELGYGFWWYDWEVRELVGIPPDWKGYEGFQTNVAAIPAEKLESVEARLAATSEPQLPLPRVRVVRAEGHREAG